MVVTDYSGANKRVTDQSKPFMDSLALFLLLHQNLSVEVGNHIDERGDDSYNLEITQSRAEWIMQYLIESGINPSRLTAVGYGEEHRIFTEEDYANCMSNDDAEQLRIANRRTVFKIIGFSNKIVTESEIESYVEYVDSMVEQNLLEKREYPNMSKCGGALNGYYLNDSLVLIDAIYGAELGAIFNTWYILNGSPILNKVNTVRLTEPADWDVYCRDHKNESGDCDYSFLESTTTTTVIKLRTTPEVSLTSDSAELWSDPIDSGAIISSSLECLIEMIRELRFAR